MQRLTKVVPAKEPWRSVFQFAVGAAASRLVLALLFILLVYSTRDPEPWYVPMQMDFPGTFVTRQIWQLTGWPPDYTGPTQLSFLGICVTTWSAIGAGFGLFIGLSKR